MEPLFRSEKEKVDGHLGYIMVKGDLGREVIKYDSSIAPGNLEAEEKVRRWLTESLEEYADKICGIKVKVMQTKIIKGLNKERLVELYGIEHEKWMDSLSKDDFIKQMEIFDGTMSPITIATVMVDATINSSEAEEKLVQVRNSLRGDWHEYLGKKEIKLPGGSTIFLSAIHVGNYDKDRQFLRGVGII